MVATVRRQRMSDLLIAHGYNLRRKAAKCTRALRNLSAILRASVGVADKSHVAHTYPWGQGACPRVCSSAQFSQIETWASYYIHWRALRPSY